jgi:hypothetical protein
MEVISNLPNWQKVKILLFYKDGEIIIFSREGISQAKKRK